MRNARSFSFQAIYPFFRLPENPIPKHKGNLKMIPYGRQTISEADIAAVVRVLLLLKAA